MIVEKIEPINTKRRKISLDNGLVFALYNGEIHRFKIEEGKELLEDSYYEILQTILIKRAKERLAYLIKDGDYTAEPVKSTYGYHIILRVSQKERPKLEDVKDDVKDALVLEKISADSNLRNKAWVKIRKKYNLKIEDSAIEKIYNNTIKDLEK